MNQSVYSISINYNIYNKFISLFFVIKRGRMRVCANTTKEGANKHIRVVSRNSPIKRFIVLIYIENYFNLW